MQEIKCNLYFRQQIQSKKCNSKFRDLVPELRYKNKSDNKSVSNKMTIGYSIVELTSSEKKSKPSIAQRHFQ